MGVGKIICYTFSFKWCCKRENVLKEMVLLYFLHLIYYVYKIHVYKILKRVYYIVYYIYVVLTHVGKHKV